jgi:hypothetical protein
MKAIVTPSAFRAAIMLCVALLTHALPAQQAAPQLTLHGEVRRTQFMTYQEVPFDVPAGTSRLTVDFAYTGHDMGTSLDMGVIDPERFRGWSGGNKHAFTVSESDATPSYLPGPLPAGKWRLLVGVPAIREGSVAQYTVRVWLQRGNQPSPFASTFSDKPIHEGAGWYRGDLHMHTAHSDGSCLSQSGVRVPCPVFLTVEAAAARGLDFIAITDHNTVAHYNSMRELQPYFDKMLLIPGREITTFLGHANVFGTTQFIEFRLTSPTVPNMNKLLDAVEAAHGLISLNHPGNESGEKCMGCGWTAPDTDYARIQAIEAVNGPDTDSPFSGTPVWQKQLDKGLRLTAIGGSDNHNAQIKPGQRNAIGSPTTVVHAKNLSETAILEAIRAGHVFIDTEGTHDRLLNLTATQGTQHVEMGDTLRAPAGTTLTFNVETQATEGMHTEIVIDGKHQPLEGNTFTQPGDGKHHTVRIEVRNTAGKLMLLGNPIYLNY